MTKLFCSSIALSFAAILSALFAAASFATTDPCNSRLFSPDGDLCVTISATRSAQKRKHVGTATTVLTREELQRRGVRNLADALKRVPGVAMARTGGYGSTTNIRVRGSDSGQVKVILDGVVLNDPSNTENFFDFSTLQTHDVERIEIIRGPQSSLYGADTTGGVISITTRRPDQGSQTNAFAETGSHHTYRAGGSHYQVIGPVSFGGSVSHYRTEGFNRITTGTEIDGAHDTDVKANIAYQVMDNLKLIANCGFAFGTSDFDPTLTTDGPAYQDKETAYINTKAEHEMLNGRVKQTLSLDLFDVSRDFDEPLGFYRYSKYEGQRQQATYQADISFRERDLATLGLDWEKDEAETSTTRLGVASPGLGSQIINRAAYGQYIFGVGDDFTITAGGRLDEHSKFGKHATYRLTSAYHLPETNTTFRATYGTGFKAPSIFQLNAAGFGNPNLQPEESVGYDAGVEQKLMDGRLRFNVTAFKSETKNLVTFDFGTFTYQNINRANVWGVESAAGYDITPYMTVSANHTYMNTEDESTSRTLPRRPTHSAGVALDMDVMEDAKLGIEALHVSDMWDRPTGPLRVRSHTTYNATGSVELNKHYTVYVNLENLTDHDYEEIVGLQAPGFMAFVGLRASY